MTGRYFAGDHRVGARLRKPRVGVWMLAAIAAAAAGLVQPAAASQGGAQEGGGEKQEQDSLQLPGLGPAGPQLPGNGVQTLPGRVREEVGDLLQGLGEKDGPDRFFLRFEQAYLVYEPGGGSPQIVTENNVLSYGQNWQVRRLKPFLFHLRNRNWKNFFWKVNTSRKSAFRVTNGRFGQLGGSEEDLDIAVDPVGNASDPDRFLLRFSDAYLVHAPAQSTTQIAAQNSVLSYGQAWTITQQDRHSYKLDREFWKNFHWRADLLRERVFRVRGAPDPCGGDEPLDITVEEVPAPSAEAHDAFGCVYAAAERPDGEAYPETAPLADADPSTVVGREGLTASHPRAMVKVNLLDPDTGKVVAGPAQALRAAYDLRFAQSGGAREVVFEVVSAESGEVVHRSEPVRLAAGNNQRHILVPGEGAEVGDIAFPDGEKTGVFTRVGRVELPDITGKGFAAFDEARERWQDAPFGGSLRLFGAFSRGFYPQSGSGDYCYKLRVQPESGGSTYVEDPLKKTRYVVMQDGAVRSESKFLGPMTVGQVEDCYRLTPLASEPGNADPANAVSVFWSFPDLLAKWHTHRRNGRHTVALELYDTRNGDRVNLLENDNLSFALYLDNTPITLSFDTLTITGSGNTDLLKDRCAVGDLADNSTLQVDFTAHQPSGFLAHYGLAAVSNTNVRAWDRGGSYQAPSWSGTRPPAFTGRADRAPAFSKAGSDFTAGPCAYRLTLSAAARTTNGYHRIHRRQKELFYFFRP